MCQVLCRGQGLQDLRTQRNQLLEVRTFWMLAKMIDLITWNPSCARSNSSLSRQADNAQCWHHLYGYVYLGVLQR